MDTNILDDFIYDHSLNNTGFKYKEGEDEYDVYEDVNCNLSILKVEEGAVIQVSVQSEDLETVCYSDSSWKTRISGLAEFVWMFLVLK